MNLTLYLHLYASSICYNVLYKEYNYVLKYDIVKFTYLSFSILFLRLLCNFYVYKIAFLYFVEKKKPNNVVRFKFKSYPYSYNIIPV